VENVSVIFTEPLVKVPATLLPELFRLFTGKISNSVPALATA